MSAFRTRDITGYQSLDLALKSSRIIVNNGLNCLNWFVRSRLNRKIK